MALSFFIFVLFLVTDSHAIISPPPILDHFPLRADPQPDSIFNRSGPYSKADEEFEGSVTGQIGDDQITLDDIECHFFYPENLGNAIGYIGWGNNTGGSPGDYRDGLRHLASHGIIVAAAETGSAGDGRDMQDCVTAAMIKYPSSTDPMIMYAGHSQGAEGAMFACNEDFDCKGTVLMSPSYDIISGNIPLSQRGKMLLIASRFEIVGAPAIMADNIFYNTNVPVNYMLVNTPAPLPWEFNFNEPLFHHDHPLGDFGYYKSLTTAFMLSIMDNHPDGERHLDRIDNVRGYSLKKRNY